jgi:N-methylhydantoinase B
MPADPLAVEILRGRLQSIVDEAGATLVRTAFSSIIREAMDFSCAILTPDGRTVVQSSQSIPVFLGTLGATTRAILERFPVDTWRAGDMAVTNDPWIGTAHLFDITALAPVLVDGEVVAFAGVVAHVPDIGGTAWSMTAREIYEEGVRIPPLKVVREGVPDATFYELLEANVRVPHEVLGDLAAILNCTTVIDTRTAAICAERSRAAFTATCDALHERTEHYLRRAIAATPDGTQTVTAHGEGVDGHDFDVQLSLTVAGDELTIDYTGTSAQTPTSLNASLPYTIAYTMYALKCALAPELPFNEGLLAPLHVVAPHGSVVHSRFPAAGAFRHLVGHYLPTLVFDALGAIRGAPLMAECGVPQPYVHLSGTSDGERSVIPLVATGGFGARADHDGPSCLAFPLNTRTVPVEMIEATGIVRIDAKELIADSGGAGRQRGGLGQRTTFRALVDGVEVRVGAQLDHPPAGAEGGASGAAVRLLIDDDAVPGLAEGRVLARGQRLTIESAGGGGYGPVAERDPAAHQADLEDGYVS